MCTHLRTHLARNALVVFLAAMLGLGIKRQSWFHDQVTFINNTGSTLPPFRAPDITPETCSVRIQREFYVVVIVVVVAMFIVCYFNLNMCEIP